MKKLSRILSTVFALIIILLGWGGWLILQNIYPGLVFSWYPFIPLTFLIMGTLLISILANSYKMEDKKFINLFMVVKLIKLLTAMIYVLVFYFAVGKDLRIFGITFATFYAVYIGLETYIFYLMEKQIKKEKK